MAFKKLAIGNDHVAVDMKNEIMAYLQEKGYEVVNVGTDSPERFNYPISGYKVAKMVTSGEVDGGILICGTGVGISLSANKVQGIRCVTCSEAKDIVDAWLGAEYEGGRHQVRIDMIDEIGKTQHLAAAEE